MKKDTDSESKSYKKTRDELNGLPFESIKERNKAEDEIYMANWKRLTAFKSFRELIGRPEFKELNDEFKAGLMCGYSEEEKSGSKQIEGNESILKVYKASLGIQVIINEKKPIDPVLMAQLAKSLTDSFGLLYYSICGLIPAAESKSPADGLKSSFGKD